VGCVFDIFGGTRRNIESLKAQTEYERLQLEAAYLTPTANVVTAAVREASLRGQIAATQQIIEIESEELDRQRREFVVGAAANTAVLQQEATLAQERARRRSRLQKSLTQTRDQLAALLGRPPADMPTERFELTDLQLPQEQPVTLPSQLVQQRPDIRSAEAQLHSESALIGVAIRQHAAADQPLAAERAAGDSLAVARHQLDVRTATACWQSSTIPDTTSAALRLACTCGRS
jgi:outer membrane protein TolC